MPQKPFLQIREHNYSLILTGSKGFKIADIRERFLTCLPGFMQGVLGAHFNREDIVLQRPRLLFVADPYGQ